MSAICRRAIGTVSIWGLTLWILTAAAIVWTVAGSMGATVTGGLLGGIVCLLMQVDRRIEALRYGRNRRQTHHY